MLHDDEYFLRQAFNIAVNSRCLRRKVGALLVKDNIILLTSFNRAAEGLQDCFELGCLRDQLSITSGKNYEICRAVHSEQNILIQCALKGINPTGSTLYCTHSPCIICAKMIINAKISRVIYAVEYSEVNFKSMFDNADIQYQKIDVKGIYNGD